jgi:hypothetical protein
MFLVLETIQRPVPAHVHLINITGFNDHTTKKGTQ